VPLKDVPVASIDNPTPHNPEAPFRHCQVPADNALLAIGRPDGQVSVRHILFQALAYQIVEAVSADGRMVALLMVRAILVLA
jgi:hypothetical protein